MLLNPYIAELIKIKPDKKVINWFETVPDRELYLSVLTIGEIRKGLVKDNNDAKRETIRAGLDYELITWFSDRILPIDQHVANKLGLLLNKTLLAIDSLIAATALHSDLIIVTRNTKDFDIISLETINPFL